MLFLTGFEKMDRYKIALKKKAKFVCPNRKEWKKFIESLLIIREIFELDSMGGLDRLEGLKYAETRIRMKYPDKHNNKGLAFPPIPTQSLDHALLILQEEITIKGRQVDFETRGLRNRYVSPGVYVTQITPRDLHDRIIL